MQHARVTQRGHVPCVRPSPAASRHQRFVRMLRLQHVSCPVRFCWTVMCLKWGDVCKSSQDQGLASLRICVGLCCSLDILYCSCCCLNNKSVLLKEANIWKLGVQQLSGTADCDNKNCFHFVIKCSLYLFSPLKHIGKFFKK